MKTLMILLLSVTMFGCQSEKKAPEIRLAEYNQPDAAKNMSGVTSSIIPDEVLAAEEEAKKAAVQVVEVSIEGTDQMTFSKDELRVPAGSTVRLTLIHSGEMPANVMGHNVVILKKGTDVSTFGMEAMNFPENSYVPKNSKEVVAFTEIIGGGESTTIEFEAPAAGTYTFVCSFPGHYAMMKGKFIVE